MPKSKKRGGEKNHRKKIQMRNNLAKAKENAIQKMFEESMKQQIEDLKKQKESGENKDETPKL